MEAFWYLGVCVDKTLRANIHLEEIKVNIEEWIGKVVLISKVNGKWIEVR